jgi:hypothetical protein
MLISNPLKHLCIVYHSSSSRHAKAIALTAVTPNQRRSSSVTSAASQWIQTCLLLRAALLKWTTFNSISKTSGALKSNSKVAWVIARLVQKDSGALSGRARLWLMRFLHSSVLEANRSFFRQVLVMTTSSVESNTNTKKFQIVWLNVFAFSQTL